MWLKQCHKPPIWEWFIYIPPIYGDLGDGLLLLYPHYCKKYLNTLYYLSSVVNLSRAKNLFGGHSRFNKKHVEIGF